MLFECFECWCSPMNLGGKMASSCFQWRLAMMAGNSTYLVLPSAVACFCRSGWDCFQLLQNGSRNLNALNAPKLQSWGIWWFGSPQRTVRPNKFDPVIERLDWQRLGQSDLPQHGRGTCWQLVGGCWPNPPEHALFPMFPRNGLHRYAWFFSEGRNLQVCLFFGGHVDWASMRSIGSW